MPIFSFIRHILTELFRKTNNWQYIYIYISTKKRVHHFTPQIMSPKWCVMKKKYIRILQFEHHLFPSEIWSMRTVFLWCNEKSNFKQNVSIMSIYSWSKVQEKNMSRERALNLTIENIFGKTISQLEFH